MFYILIKYVNLKDIYVEKIKTDVKSLYFGRGNRVNDAFQ